MQLAECAIIRTGLVLARKLSEDSQGECYRLLTLRSMDPSGYILVDKLDDFWAKECLPEDYLSQVGDIVVRLTAPHTAILIDESTVGLLISSNFLIVRIRDERLLPEYLLWLLNSSRVKRSFYSKSRTNTLASINVKWFLGLDVPMLPTEKQHKVAMVDALVRKETILLQQLTEIKAKYHELLLERISETVYRGVNNDTSYRY